ncbi:MAG: hypothetical protein IPK01_08470 [Acidobacteria bacterium]|nr:hypothetical protein [Acidobacteriota bacterium]
MSWNRALDGPGTLPVTEGTALEREMEAEVASGETSRPYSVPSKHERRRSSQQDL